MRVLAPVLIIGLIVPVLAGCIGDDDTDIPVDLPDEGLYMADLVFDGTDKWSQTLTEALYDIDTPVEFTVPSALDGTSLSVGVVMPKGIAEGTKVPVILDAGPYYADGEGAVTEPTDNRLAGFLVKTFVPHGYAVAMMSVRGTGNSMGCMDFMGEKEQADIDTVVTWLGAQDWSNGNVGMIGRSYDGSTPWEAAQFGNPALKTIVPISGLSSVGDMYFRNGTSEGRASILGALYWTYGATEAGLGGPTANGDEHKVLCPDIAEHIAQGVQGTYTGGMNDPATDYWAERDFKPDVLANYEGSVFLIHGLQDWNVDPHMATDIWNELDVEKKLWFGQWMHMYPDRPGEHECGLCAFPDSVRWDWAEVLLQWFDKYLKGMDVDTGPVVETQDDKGDWHVETAWPPEGVQWQKLYLGDGVLAHEETPHAALMLAQPGGQRAATPDLVFTSEAFANDTRLTGLPRLHFTVTPTTPGGNLIADLYDVSDDGRKWVGHAFMDLRFAAGGDQMAPVVPGQELDVKMELFPLDVLIPAGNSLELVLSQERQKLNPSNPAAVATNIAFGDPVLNPATGPIMVHVGGDFGSAFKMPVVVNDTSLPLGWSVRMPAAVMEGVAEATEGA